MSEPLAPLRNDPARTAILLDFDGSLSEIVLYRRTIMRVAHHQANLRQVVHETILHELGHLFGMSESDLDQYTIGNNPRPDAQPVRPILP